MAAAGVQRLAVHVVVHQGHHNEHTGRQRIDHERGQHMFIPDLECGHPPQVAGGCGEQLQNHHHRKPENTRSAVDHIKRREWQDQQPRQTGRVDAARHPSAVKQYDGPQSGPEMDRPVQGHAPVNQNQQDQQKCSKQTEDHRRVRVRTDHGKHQQKHHQHQRKKEHIGHLALLETHGHPRNDAGRPLLKPGVAFHSRASRAKRT